MSTVDLICGNTGAGKSTYAAQLAKQKRAISFSIDPWMQTLYRADYDPAAHSFSWLMERVKRCQSQIREVAESLLKQNMDVILDFGFREVESRNFYREWAHSLGAKPALHFLNISSEIRRERVHKRNDEKGATFSFEVSDEMFDYLESSFVPPTEEELEGGWVIQ